MDGSQSAPGTLDAAWGQQNWEELLDYIKQKTVIPIIGPDLVLVEREGKTVTLDLHVALELAAKLGLPPGVVGETPSLHRVMCAYYELNPKGSKRYPYTVVPKILKQTTFKTPEPLRQLAEITDFHLYINTTFDTLLVDTLNQVRYGGQVGVEQITYWYKEPADLQQSLAELQNANRAAVFHLLGQACANPNSYVLTEEDLLEFMHALQSESHSPKRVLDELATHNLLFIGEVFPDWLKRLLLRKAKNEKLSSLRNTNVLADSRGPGEESLRTFLQHFGSGLAWMYPDGPTHFVAELHRRWREENPGTSLQETVPFVPPPKEMPPGAVFLSYAAADRNAVIAIKHRLEKAGVPVWFDKADLGPGDIYPPRIAANIKSCLLFMPVISRSTEKASRDRYFRSEWNAAKDKGSRFRDDEIFIIPVIVDDLPSAQAELEFPKVTTSRAVEGALDDKAVEWIAAVYAKALAASKAHG